MELVKGKVYKVYHSRKGEFSIKIIKDGDWVKGEIVDGVAKAMNRDNTVFEGEVLDMRKSLCSFELDNR